jgi:hypothetical protein
LRITPASNAASPTVSSLSCLPRTPSGAAGSGVRKNRRVAAFTPYEPCPKYTVLRYCLRISRFEYLSLRR